MEREDLTPEVLVALAAGHLRPSAAEQARRAIAASEDLALEYEGARTLVEQMGASGALEYLQQAHDRYTLRVGQEVKGGATGRAIPIWAIVSALAASLLVIVYFLVGGPAQRPEQLAEVVLKEAPRMELSRGDAIPSWAEAFDRGDHAQVIELLRTSGALAPRESLIMGYSLLQLQPPQQDSALVWFERAAEPASIYRDQALLYAGSLAVRVGDPERARRLLKDCGDQRATELLERLSDQ